MAAARSPPPTIFVVDGGELTDVDTSTDFNFTIKLSDSTVDGVYGDITFVAGVAEITLHHGEPESGTSSFKISSSTGVSVSGTGG